VARKGARQSARLDARFFVVGLLGAVVGGGGCGAGDEGGGGGRSWGGKAAPSGSPLFLPFSLLHDGKRLQYMLSRGRDHFPPNAGAVGDHPTHALEQPDAASLHPLHHLLDVLLRQFVARWKYVRQKFLALLRSERRQLFDNVQPIYHGFL